MHSGTYHHSTSTTLQFLPISNFSSIQNNNIITTHHRPPIPIGHDYRFAPMMYPSVMKFKVDGVSLGVGMHNCNQITCTVTLDQLEPQTSGAYRCEISGDAPEFKLVSRTANMTVAGDYCVIHTDIHTRTVHCSTVQHSRIHYKSEVVWILTFNTWYLVLLALPRHDPNVNGLATTYSYGDFVQANCTTDISSPPATLSWYINDEQVCRIRFVII